MYIQALKSAPAGRFFGLALRGRAGGASRRPGGGGAGRASRGGRRFVPVRVILVKRAERNF